MPDYKKLRTVCRKNSALCLSVVDDFLIHYAADRGNLERKMEKEFSKYRHVTRKFQNSWMNMLKAQYLAHRLFKRDGLINKFINHSALNHLSSSKKTYLRQQIEHPWKFSFSEIIGHPAEHFYEMEDVFTGDSYLLYSPGVSDLLVQQPVQLWFNLIAYNGHCWQTYGPIGAYQSFEPEDIHFFTSELHPHGWVEEDEILRMVENDPVPYMMLLSGSAYPLSFHQEDQIVQILAEHPVDSFQPSDLGIHFIIEYAHGVYRLSLQDWSEFPHYSVLYYDEKEGILLLTAMTDCGFEELVDCLIDYGYDISSVPDFRVNPSMLSTAGDILKQEFYLNEYDALFSKETSEESFEELDKVNRFLALLMPDINAGRKPDIEKLAKRAGVDVETAGDIVQQLMDRLGTMNNK